MHLDILTPEKKLYSGEVRYVEMPGIDGYFGVLDNHAAMVSALGAGKITVDQMATEGSEGLLPEAKNQRFVVEVNGGIAEVFHNKVIVLLD